MREGQKANSRFEVGFAIDESLPQLLDTLLAIDFDKCLSEALPLENLVPYGSSSSHDWLR